MNKKSQLYKYPGLFVVLIIFLVLMSGRESFGSIDEDNSLDTSKGQRYGKNFDNIPNLDGSGGVIIFQQGRNIYEEGKWKRLKDAKSLKNKGFEWVYLEDDSRYEIEIEDYNYTHIKKFKLKTKDAGNVPFKYGVYTHFFRNFLPDVEYEFENIRVNNIFAHNYTFGEHSTTIILQTPDTENLGDTWVDDETPTLNNGGYTYVGIGHITGWYNSYFKFNITKCDDCGLPSGKIIHNSTLWLYSTTANGGDVSKYYDGFHIYNQTWHEGTQQGVAGSMDWYDQPCGIDWDDSTQCNLTVQDSVNSILTENLKWWQWNITRALSQDYNLNNNNFSYGISMRVSGVSDPAITYMYLSSKEHATAGQRPMLRIEYEEPVDTTYPTFTSHLNNNSNPYYNENINLSINVIDDTDIDFVTFSTNDSGSWINFTFEPTATTSHFNYTNLKIASTKNVLVGYAWYANDTASNVNRTLNQSDDSYYFFRVSESPPVTNTVEINPSTPYFYDTLNCGANVTNDDGWANTNFTWFFQDDGAGAWHLNATELLINITSNADGNTTININSTWLNKDDVWICQAIAYDPLGSNVLNSSSVTVLETAPTIEIIYPVNDTNYVDNVTVLNYVYTSANPDKCWYSLNAGANVSMACGTNITGINAVDGLNNWTAYINSTYGTEARSPVSFTFLTWEEKYQTFNNRTYETKNETFILNISIRTEADLYSATLIYNETSYPISSIVPSGNSLLLTRSIDIPLNSMPFSNMTNQFYWNFVYTYGANQITENSTKYKQNVTFVNFQLCNTTPVYSTEAVNFTFRDELDGIEIDPLKNLTSIEATFRYWLGAGNTYRNYSYANITSNATSQYQFCINPYWETLITDMDMDYEAVDYAPRTYFFRSAPLDNVTNLIDLNLLTLGEATKFFFEVRKGMLVFGGATVTISKYDSGEDIWNTVSIRETDVDGEFIEYMELDKKYRYSFVKDGVSYGYIDKVASCAESPCEVILQIEEAIEHLWAGYYDVYATNVAYTLDFDDDTSMVTYSFTDLTGLAQNFRLEVNEMQYNQSSTTICNKLLYTTIGELTCNMTGYSGDFTAKGYVSRSPERLVDLIHFIISSIKDALGITGVLVSLFIIITIGLVGTWNPTVSVVLTAFAIMMMKLLGFVAFGWTTVILVFILAGILIYHMKK